MVSPGRSTVSCRVPGYTKSWTGPLPTGDPQGDLYDQRDRVGELQPAQTHAASRRVPQRRGTDQTAVLGATQHQQEMDDADPRLEGSTEPIYDPIRGKASSAVNPIAGYTKICTPSRTSVLALSGTQRCSEKQRKALYSCSLAVNTSPQDYTVFAAAIRVDRLVEAHVGRLVAADDAARALLGDAGVRVRRRFDIAGRVGGIPGRSPAVVVATRPALLETAAHVRRRTAPPGSAVDRQCPLAI